MNLIRKADSLLSGIIIRGMNYAWNVMELCRSSRTCRIGAVSVFSAGLACSSFVTANAASVTSRINESIEDIIKLIQEITLGTGALVCVILLLWGILSTRGMEKAVDSIKKVIIAMAAILLIGFLVRGFSSIIGDADYKLK